MTNRTTRLMGKEVPITIEEMRRPIVDAAFAGELVNVHTGDGSNVVLHIE